MKAGSWNVGIETKQGKLKIRLPRAVAKDASRYISTRLDDTPPNLKKVRAMVQEIEEDISLGRFDATLAKYQFSSTPVLWQKIFEVRKSLRSKIVYATTGKMSAINFISATISV
jgi:hypothetical protein